MQGVLLSGLAVMAGERPRKHVYSLEESSHSDGAEPAPSRKGFTKSQSLDSKKAPSGEKKSRRSPKSTPSSQKSSGGRGPVKVPKVGTPSKKGSPSRSARSKASPKRNLGGNSAHKTPTGARNRKPGSSRRGKRGSRSESEDSDGIKGEDDFIGKMPAKPLDAPSSDSESEKQRLEQKQRLKQGSKRPSPAPVGVPGPGPKRVVASAHDFPGYDGEPDADSDADDHVSDSDPDWAAANASQVERDRAAQRAERRLKRPAGRAQGKAPPAQPRSAPPAEDHPWDDFDDAADFNPEGEELGAGKQMQGTLPGGNHGAANLKGEVPWWTQAHTATLDSDRPDIARRNQLLWSRRGADGSESVSDWGPTGETSSDEESPGRKAGVQNGGRGLQREPQDRDAEWPRSEGLQRAAPDGLDLDEVVPETEEEDEPPAASDGAGLGGLCPGEDPGSARAANGQPPQGADADSEATLDADPAHRYDLYLL